MHSNSRHAEEVDYEAMGIQRLVVVGLKKLDQMLGLLERIGGQLRTPTAQVNM